MEKSSKKYKCKNCAFGEIEVLKKETAKTVEFDVKKCNFCKHQYGIKGVTALDEIPSADSKVSKWIDISEAKPIAYKTGDWDGKNSDLVFVRLKDGSLDIAFYNEGFMDGSNFQDWYSQHDHILADVVSWTTVPE